MQRPHPECLDFLSRSYQKITPVRKKSAAVIQQLSVGLPETALEAALVMEKVMEAALLMAAALVLEAVPAVWTFEQLIFSPAEKKII